jgi:hypothetical protein
MGDGYGMTYFLTDQMEENLDILEQVARKADMAELLPTESSSPEAGVNVESDGETQNERE